MAEVARGAVTDRPWAEPGRAGDAGSDRRADGDHRGSRIGRVRQGGAIVGASSPLALDAAVRIALTGRVVTSPQVAESRGDRPPRRIATRSR